MDAHSPAPPGFFGKVPARGDFLSRRLPPELAARWEDWLGELTTAVREAAGPDWPEAWLTAPLWHFALGAALAPPHGAAGVLVASADRVGRLFPFTVVGACDPRLATGDDALGRWGSAVESLVLDALEDGFDPAALDAALAELGPPPPVTGPERMPGARALGGNEPPPSTSLEPPPEPMAEPVPEPIAEPASEPEPERDALADILDDPPEAAPSRVSADLADILGDEPEEAVSGPERHAPAQVVAAVADDPPEAAPSRISSDLADILGDEPEANEAVPGSAGRASALGDAGITDDDRPGAGQSVWWCGGSDRVAPVRLRCAGLPGPATRAAMVLGGAEVSPG